MNCDTTAFVTYTSKNKLHEEKEITNSLARFTWLKIERIKRKAAVAPVKRMLEVTSIVEGSCVVVEMKGVEILGSSMVPVVSWSRWLSHGEVGTGMAEIM